MLELAEKNFKITMINYVKDIMKQVENIWEQVDM